MMAKMNLRNMFSKITSISQNLREPKLRRVLAQKASVRFQVCCAALTPANNPIRGLFNVLCGAVHLTFSQPIL